MIVWLWEAPGPARAARGVTDDEATAWRAAETCLSSGQARFAAVEKAHALLGVRSLTSGYERTGDGWMAECRQDGRISWTPLPSSSGLAAS